MRSEEILEMALGSPVNIRLLRILKKPGAGFMSIRQMARLTALNPVTLSRALRSLKELGVVDYVQAGRSQLWRLIPSYAQHLLTPVLDALSSVPDMATILRRLVRQDPKIPAVVAEIVLFGSAASNEATPESDVDLFVLLEKNPQSQEVEDFFDRLRRIIFEEIGMRVSILPQEKKKFHLLKEPLKRNIKAGVVLYEKDSNTGHRSV